MSDLELPNHGSHILERLDFLNADELAKLEHASRKSSASDEECFQGVPKKEIDQFHAHKKITRWTLFLGTAVIFDPAHMKY
jgi:hypothetical protein